MQNLMIKIELENRFVSGLSNVSKRETYNIPTVDGSLGGMHYHVYGEFSEDDFYSRYIDQKNGVALASRFIVKNYFKKSVPKYGSLAGSYRKMGNELYDITKKVIVKGKQTVPSMREETKFSTISSFQTVFDPLDGGNINIIGFCYGNKKEISTLIRRSGYFGAKTTSGNGKIKDFEIIELDDENKLVTNDFGHYVGQYVARPIPLSVFDGNNFIYNTNKESFKNPYWHSPQVPCAIPTKEYYDMDIQ